MKKSLILITSILVLTGCGVQNQPITLEPSPSEPKIKTITIEEIGTHSSRDDCWLAIEGKVYDVSSFIADAKHPGGEAILSGCGKDATELFNTRPMGSNTPHSPKARDLLANFVIGELERN